MAANSHTERIDQTQLSELERLAEEDGAVITRSPHGVWYAKDKDGVTVVHGALSKVEAAVLYCEDKDLTAATPEAILARLRYEFRPYDSLPAFDEGFAAHAARQWHNPYPSSVEAQAWDRGLQTAVFYERALAGLDKLPAGEKAGPGWLSKFLRTGEVLTMQQPLYHTSPRPQQPAPAPRRPTWDWDRLDPHGWLRMGLVFVGAFIGAFVLWPMIRPAIIADPVSARPCIRSNVNGGIKCGNWHDAAALLGETDAPPAAPAHQGRRQHERR
jgi:hypothetical protein